MKKILCVLTVIAICVFLFGGCASAGVCTVQSTMEQPARRFEAVCTYQLTPDDIIYVVRDVQTDVLYMYVRGYRKGGLQVMVSSDGSPLLYEEWHKGAS